RVRLWSTAPRSGLPADVTGLALAGDPYTTRTLVSVYSPTDGAVGDLTLDERPVRPGSGSDGRRHVAILAVDVPAGGSRTLTATVLTALPRSPVTWREPALWLTPAATPWERTVTAAPPCGRRCGPCPVAVGAAPVGCDSHRRGSFDWTQKYV